MSRYADGVDRFSNSEIMTWHDCRRKWMLQYFMSLRPKRRDVRFPLATGQLVHGAFEQFYLNGGIHGEDAETTAITWLAAQRALDLRDCAEEHTKTIETAHKAAEACFRSYLHWLDETGKDLNLRILAPEEKIVMPGPVPNSELNGRIDLLAEDTRNGDIVVLDLKLVQSIQDKIRTLNFDFQAKTYALLAREKFGRPVRVAFRLVKINQRSARTKGPQEEEYTIHLNNAQLDTYWTQLGGVMQDIISAQARLSANESHQVVAYPSPSDSCSWKCPFFAVCPMMDDPRSDAMWVLDNHFESRIQSTESADTIETDTNTDPEVS